MEARPCHATTLHQTVEEVQDVRGYDGPETATTTIVLEEYHADEV